jgi:soluble lytic murein transglycosylase
VPPSRCSRCRAARRSQQPRAERPAAIVPGQLGARALEQPAAERRPALLLLRLLPDELSRLAGRDGDAQDGRAGDRPGRDLAGRSHLLFPRASAADAGRPCPPCLCAAREGASPSARGGAQGLAGGVLPRADEERLLSLFGASLTQQDHDARMEALLATATRQSARDAALTSRRRAAVYEARLALQTRARRRSAARHRSARRRQQRCRAADGPRTLAARRRPERGRALAPGAAAPLAPPHDAEKWFETLLVLARGAAATATGSRPIRSPASRRRLCAGHRHHRPLGGRARRLYQPRLACRHDRAPPAGRRPTRRDVRAMRAAAKSPQVLTKGLYWAGARAAGRPAAQANAISTKRRGIPSSSTGSSRSSGSAARCRPRPPSSLGADGGGARRLRAQRESSRRRGCSGSSAAGKTSRCSSARSPKPRTTATGRSPPSFRRRSAGRTSASGWRAAPATRRAFLRRGRLSRSAHPGGAEPLLVARPRHHPPGKLVRPRRRQPAGARGMMQLMPARRASRPARSAVLRSRPPDPRSRLQHHARQPLFRAADDQWGGNAPLAVASYNAGRGQCPQMGPRNGDPRMPASTSSAGSRTSPSPRRAAMCSACWRMRSSTTR